MARQLSTTSTWLRLAVVVTDPAPSVCPSAGAACWSKLLAVGRTPMRIEVDVLHVVLTTSVSASCERSGASRWLRWGRDRPGADVRRRGVAARCSRRSGSVGGLRRAGGMLVEAARWGPRVDVCRDWRGARCSRWAGSGPMLKLGRGWLLDGARGGPRPACLW